MILITGAGGKTGQALLRRLVKRGERVRTFVRTSEQGARLVQAGTAEAVTGDICREEDLRRAFQGVQAVYHIAPNMNPDELLIGKLALQAARAAGVLHFVYHSVLHPQVESMPHHWQKMRVEEQVFESGLDFTILQPAAYMQNVLAQWDSIATRGIYPVPYGVDSRLGMVDLEDVAEAASIVLCEGGHRGAIYELAGPEALTQREAAEVFGRVLGREVRAEVVPLDEWEERARRSGMGEYAVETLLKMFRYYDRYGLWGNPKALTGLLGREPVRFEDFLRRQILK
jgi:uncharacterized protein YbjT (DUF2867 family)